MFQVAIVVFREFLEISILISLFSVAARNVKDFKLMLTGGIMFGILGASIVAFFTEQISDSLDGTGGDIFDATIILVTVAMICSTLVWMKSYSSKLKHVINEYSEKVETSFFSKVMLTLLISTSMFREGSEIVLLLHSVSSIQTEDAVSYLQGFGIGAFMGISLGVALYFGLFKFATKYVFSISSIFMTFIAAGLSAEAAKILLSIGTINILDEQIWNTSMYILTKEFWEGS